MLSLWRFVLKCLFTSMSVPNAAKLRKCCKDFQTNHLPSAEAVPVNSINLFLKVRFTSREPAGTQPITPISPKVPQNHRKRIKRANPQKPNHPQPDRKKKRNPAQKRTEIHWITPAVFPKSVAGPG